MCSCSIPVQCNATTSCRVPWGLYSHDNISDPCAEHNCRHLHKPKQMYNDKSEEVPILMINIKSRVILNSLSASKFNHLLMWCGWSFVNYCQSIRQSYFIQHLCNILLVTHTLIIIIFGDPRTPAHISIAAMHCTMIAASGSTPTAPHLAYTGLADPAHNH